MSTALDARNRSTTASRRQIVPILLYIGAPSLSALAPLAVIPAITARLGADGWAAAAIALAIGNAGMVVAEVGWGVIGPQLVAKSPRDRLGLYRRAQACKLLTVAILAPVAALLAAALVPVSATSAACLAGATLLTALSPAWFFVGAHRPALVLLCDTIPRVALSVAAAVVIALGGQLFAYACALGAAAVIGWILAWRFGSLPLFPRKRDLARAPATIRAQAPLALGRAISTVYTSLPSAFLGVVAPAGVAAYTALDRPLRMGFGILGAVPARLQSYVAVTDATLVRRRSLVAIGVNTVVGLVSAAVFAVAMPVVVPILFSGAIEVDSSLVVLGSVLLVVMSTSRGFGLALVSAGAARSISLAIVAAAATAAVAIPTLGALGGAAGAVTAVISAEAVGTAAQAFLLRRAWRRASPATAS